MKTTTGKRLERTMELIYLSKSRTHRVEVTRPLGRRYVTRTYKPTPASLRRVRRVVGGYTGTGPGIMFARVKA